MLGKFLNCDHGDHDVARGWGLRTQGCHSPHQVMQSHILIFVLLNVVLSEDNGPILAYIWAIYVRTVITEAIGDNFTVPSLVYSLF